jgi:hypothetical protein
MRNSIGDSQVQAIGEPPPKTWSDYERFCYCTFGGGYGTAEQAEIFNHAMGTVFRLLRSEFPEAHECKAVTDLLAACKGAHKAIDMLFAMLISADENFFPSKSGQPWDAMLAINAAVAKAERRTP